MRILFFSRKTLIFVSILVVILGLCGAVQILGCSESVAAWVQSGVDFGAE